MLCLSHHKLFLLSLGLLFGPIFLYWLPAVAEQPQLPTQANAISPELTALKNRYFIAQAQYELSASEENKSALRSRLEQLVAVLCMPQLHYSGLHSPELNSEECVARSNELLEHIPNNPIALCAKDGYQSSSCIEAYQNQLIDSQYRPRNSTKTRIPASFDLDLKDIAEAFQTTPSKVSLSNLHSFFQPHLQEQCSDIIVEYENDTERAEQSAQELRRGRASNKKSRNSAELKADRDDTRLRALMNEFISEKLTSDTENNSESQNGDDSSNSPSTADQESRVRKIPVACNTLIEKLLSVYPRSSLAWCYRVGWYSPTCVELGNRDGLFDASNHVHGAKPLETAPLATRARRTKATEPIGIDRF